MNKSILFILLCLIAAALAPLAAQEAKAMDALNAAIERKDYAAAGTLLEAADNAESKAAAEAAVVAAAKKAVLSGDLDAASALIEKVLLVDLDNADAQDLYASIQDEKRQKQALEERRLKQEREAREKAEAEARAKAEREAAEAKAKLVREEAEAKAKAEREEALAKEREETERKRQAEEAERRKRAEAEAFIESVRTVGIKNFKALAEFSPASFMLAKSEFSERYAGSAAPAAAYGYGIAAEGFFEHPYVAAYVATQWDHQPLPLGGNDIRRLFSFRAGIGYPAIGLPLFIYGGFRTFAVTASDGGVSDAVLFNSAGGPTIGIGLERWFVSPRLTVSARAGWAVVSAIDPLLDFAANLDLTVRWRLVDWAERAGLYVGSSLGADVAMAGGKSEWLYSFNLCVGVVLNEKVKN